MHHTLISTRFLLYWAQSAGLVECAMNINRLLCAQPSPVSSTPNITPPASQPDESGGYDTPSPSPSSPETQTKFASTQYRCGKCRQRGHNRKTCPNPEVVKALPPAPARPRARGCCALCGEPGHNRTSCRVGLPKS
ncbi:hypothetical protein B0H10DRAFT_2004635 [Mycena sp. CBHHK59/15]|nr:hypothetical protein B0H10DRAFT_2004635 [Mycena sp. CBHHK59/15]